MPATTGPILAMGTITLVNSSFVHNKPIDWRIPIATGLGTIIFAGLEKVNSDFFKAITYLGLVTILFSRTQKNVPSPTESMLDWWNGKTSATIYQKGEGIVI